MKKKLGLRFVAWLLTFCSVLGLVPTVAVFQAEAADIATETTNLINELKNSYNSLTLPVNKEVFNYTSLDGVFFIRESASGKTINFANARVEHTDRLTANTSSGEAASKYYHLNSIGISASNNGSFTAVNGSTPNNLQYAVEIKKYSGTLTRDTTTKTTVDGTTYTGWAGYIKYEYNRKNAWSGDKAFGSYVGINGVPTTSDPGYSIKSLHTSRASAPYVATNNSNGSMKYSSSEFPWFLRVHTSNESVKIYKLDPSGKTRYTYWLGIDTYHNNCISAHTLSQIVREDRNKSTDTKYKNNNRQAFKFHYWDFFQISPVGLELFQALEKAKTYVTGGNSNNKYPAETYLNFLKFVKSTMATYNSKRTVWNTSKTNADRIICDSLAKDLRSYIALLEIESKPNSYMDIPLEVLDFRADGLLFEFINSNNPYGMNNASPASVAGVNLPGEIVKSEKGDGIVCWTGLIEPKLLNGSIAYKKETVDYIARALFLQQKTFSDPSASGFGAEDFDTYYNSVFMSMVDPNTGDRTYAEQAVRPSNHYFQTLGSYAETIAKTDTKSNGGILLFSQVTTYYDLAYYMLTNVWRQTDPNDIIQTVTKGSTTFKLPYNMKIPQITTMRLLKDSSGNYEFSSDKENGRNLDSGLIFNYNLTNSSGSMVPTLNAAAGLGFESSSMFGNNSTGSVETADNVYGERNYHVVYHIQSAFVYYEDKNLEFSFAGDDDVYFFINGQLVCDLGGTHSPVSRSLKLNDSVAKEQGLKDGDICTFDMYLAERHTHGINLNFKTNIEMMPVDAVTEKVQYLYTQAGVIGEDVREGAVVADKTEIGYGFKLLNRSNHAAVDLTFTDADLGVSLSEDGISLGGTANVEDLIIIYKTHDPQTGKMDESATQNLSYTNLYDMLSEAVEDMSTIVPLADGTYQVTGLTEEQLMALLELGVPANVEISIYGFHRTALASVGGYTGTLYTTCKPISGRDEDQSYTFGTTINGSSTRNLNVQNMNTVTAEPLEIVIDYGKPVTFTAEEVLKTVTYDPKDVQLSFYGIQESGTHGKIAFKEPGAISLKNVGDTLETAHGVFDVGAGFIRFTLTDMLETVERVYGIVCVKDIYMESNWYLTVEICIIPANIMYYEAEQLAENGNLTFTEKYVEEVTEAPPETEPEENPEENPDEGGSGEMIPEDDGVRINHNIAHLTDSGDVEHKVSDYSPVGDKNVLFFDFSTYADNSNPYSGNSAYGGVNFGNVSNWWSPGYGKIDSLSGGVIKFTTTNTNGDPWGYIATGKADSAKPTTANAAQFPLQYRPTEEDWLEIRLKIEKTGAQTLTDTHLRVEFFTLSGDTSVSRAAVSTKNFAPSDINNGYFFLKFPIATTLDNREGLGGIPYTQLSIIRRINFLIRGLDPNVTFTTYIDYIYIGPEETCPSNMGGNSLYFGFDNTAADRYRYTDPIYGSNFNFDVPEGWSRTTGRTPSVQVIDGVLTSTVGAAGSYSTNSPYFQNVVSGGSQLTLDYPAAAAEVVRVKLKFKDLTTDLSEDPEKVDINKYPDEAAVRLGFVLNHDATYEDSACWVDWPLSEEQLNGCEFMTLSADITELLKEHNATRIASVRLTIVKAASMAGKTGYVYVDEIYVGPRESQDSHVYVAPSKTVIPAVPAEHTNTPTYDSSVLYFGFGNTGADTERYNNNPVYKKNNFDTVAKWQGTSGRTVSVSNGALHLAGPTGSNSYTVFNTGANTSDFDHLNFVPGSDDWFEIRIKVNDTSVLVHKDKIQFDIELRKDSTYLYKINHTHGVDPTEGVQSNRYYTITFKLPANSGGWANTIPYANIGTVKRFAFNPVDLYSNKTYSCSIDYIYIGPEEKLPSKSNETDRLYFGFDNDRAAQHKYGGTAYGGDNFDTTGKWRYNYDRSSAANIAGGTMTYTLLKLGHPWFETSRNGGSANNGYGSYMHYYPADAEIVRIRVKFNNVEMMGNASGSTLTVFFGNTEGSDKAAEPVNISTTKFIPSSEISTDGKWFTYTIKLNDLLKNVPRVTGMRLSFADIYSSTNSGTISFDYIYVGPDPDGIPEGYHSDSDSTYGYDSTYTLDSVYSDNETLYAEGRGVPVINGDGSVDYEGAEQYTELGFSFTGTGFDLISRTGQNQGTIRVSVYKADEWIEDNRVKTVTVNNKGELELYQIPVVSIQGLEHGMYHVKIWVNDKVTAGSLPQIPGLNLSGLTRGNEFYLDAIRIYDPINVSDETLSDDQKVALATYEADKEAYQYIKEIRNILLTSAQFDTLSGTIPGGVFIDANSAFVDPETGNITETAHPDYITAEVKTYNKEGPKNEVYLAPGQAVAFRLAVDTKAPIGSLDIGAKTVSRGGNGTLAVGFVTDAGAVEGKASYCVRSGTAQYYAVNTSNIRYLTSDSTKTVYLVIYNESTGSREENVLSVTDIKVAYEAHPDSDLTLPDDSLGDKEIYKKSAVSYEPVRFLVDGNVPEATATFIQALWDTPPAEEEESEDPTTGTEDPEEPTSGTEEPETVPKNDTVVEDIRIYHSLNLASDISLNYLVPKADLEGYEDMTLVCTLPVYEGNDLVGTREVKLTAENREGSYYYFVLTGLKAVHMNDEVEATLRLTKDGENYSSLADRYSIAQYAYGQLSKESTKVTLKTLCAELLRYGAAAQTFKGYRTDCLVDSLMTEEQRALTMALEDVVFDSFNTVTGEGEAMGVAWVGKSLLLDSKVTIRYIVDLTGFGGEISDLSLVLSYKNIRGEEKTATLSAPVLYNGEKGFYSFDFDGLLAAELRQPVYATVYCGETPVTGMLEYSASTYGNNKTGALGDLCKALMAYSDSAKAFFAG